MSKKQARKQLAAIKINSKGESVEKLIRAVIAETMTPFDKLSIEKGRKRRVSESVKNLLEGDGQPGFDLPLEDCEHFDCDDHGVCLGCGVDTNKLERQMGHAEFEHDLQRGR